MNETLPKDIPELKQHEVFKRWTDGEGRCKDLDRVAAMTLQAMFADSAEQFQQVLVMYILDMTYDRGDICLARKIGHRIRGWNDA